MNSRELNLATAFEQSECPFSVSEYKERLFKIRKVMEVAKVDTLIVSNPAHMNYLSGYKAGWFWEGYPKLWTASSCIVVNVNHDAYVHFDDFEEILIAKLTSVPGADIRQYSDLSNNSHTSIKGLNIVPHLKQMGWLNGSVGLEFWAERPNPGYSNLFRAELEKHGARVVDGSDIIPAVTKIKTSQELEYIRKATYIVDIGFKAFVNAIHPGVTELEVFAEANLAMAKAGGEPAALNYLMGSGGKSGALHSLASRKTINYGDLIHVDFCGVFNRYHSNIARTISLGTPEKNYFDYVTKINRVYTQMSHAMKPGLSMKEWVNMGVDLSKQEGIWDNRWWVGGYTLGIAFPPSWVGYYYYDETTDLGNDVMEPGFVGNYEFNYYLPGGKGIHVLIDTWMVTKERAEFIPQTPIETLIIE